MDHKRIVMPAVERLDPDRAGYFADVVHRLSEDKRMDGVGNLVFIVLKVALPSLPTMVPKRRFMDELLDFCHVRSKAIVRIIFSPEFVTNEQALKPLADQFVGRIVGVALDAYQNGEIEEAPTRGVKRYRFDGDT